MRQCARPRGSRMWCAISDWSNIGAHVAGRRSAVRWRGMTSRANDVGAWVRAAVEWAKSPAVARNIAHWHRATLPTRSKRRGETAWAKAHERLSELRGPE